MSLTSNFAFSQHCSTNWNQTQTDPKKLLLVQMPFLLYYNCNSPIHCLEWSKSMAEGPQYLFAGVGDGRIFIWSNFCLENRAATSNDIPPVLVIQNSFTTEVLSIASCYFSPYLIMTSSIGNKSVAIWPNFCCRKVYFWSNLSQDSVVQVWDIREPHRSLRKGNVIGCCTEIQAAIDSFTFVAASES